jgi:CDP-diacylglycerol pyrophosphatase
MNGARTALTTDKWCVLLLVALLPCFACAEDDGGVLWHIVHDKCVAHEERFGTPLPCASVKQDAGYAILKDRRGIGQFLVIPTARVSGIEDPAILAPNAPNYWEPAWKATLLVDAMVDRPLPRDALSLAINSAHNRSQNQLHIHVDCLKAEVRDLLRMHGGEIGETWAHLSVPIGGHNYRAMRIQTLTQPGSTPFQVLSRLPDARADMASESLAVVGATFADGKNGFYLLETRVGPAEELQDHECALAGAK